MKFNKKTAVILHDLMMAILAWLGAWYVRFNLDLPIDEWPNVYKAIPAILSVQIFCFKRFHLYKGIWRFASLPDLWNIFRASILGAVISTLLFFILFRLEGIPRSVLVLYPVFLIFFLGGPRLGYRYWKDHTLNLNNMIQSKRIIIIGAGRAGEMLLRDILRTGNYSPIGLLDDNPNLKGREVHGVKVFGGIDKIRDMTEQFTVDEVLIAIPSASSEEMRRIVTLCEETFIPVKILPKLLLKQENTLNSLREVTIEDLLGREKIELNWEQLHKGITGQSILVTGGGGSIGSELCRQIASLGPQKLIVLDNCEFNLYKVQQELEKDFPSLELHAVLGDVCDRLRVDKVFKDLKPDCVFHAAAYKHVPILEMYCREGVRNNVIGTRVIAETSAQYNCNKFILISTDKAVNPTNVLGQTKRIAEMFCEYMDKKHNTQFITVRFGNVLGSAGSVVPLFQKQLQEGGPITVTHPKVERFFMTIPEASQLILQASSMGKGGEIFVLDMGKPVQIAFLAEQVIRLSGMVPNKDIKIEFIGLRPGEKMYEELFYNEENKIATTHPKILQALHADIDWDNYVQCLEQLSLATEAHADARVRELINSLVPVSTCKHSENNNIISINKAC